MDDLTTLEIYMTLRGKKPHEYAGFRRWAKNAQAKKTRRLHSEWEALYTIFCSRPVRRAG